MDLSQRLFPAAIATALTLYEAQTATTATFETVHLQEDHSRLVSAFVGLSSLGGSPREADEALGT